MVENRGAGTLNSFQNAARRLPVQAHGLEYISLEALPRQECDLYSKQVLRRNEHKTNSLLPLNKEEERSRR